MTQAQPTFHAHSAECQRCDYDVVVLGAGFSGSASAILLQRSLPQARILVVDRNGTTGHKVGEATVEVSALFLMRTLGLTQHLEAEHLPKHGLRFWLTDDSTRPLTEMTEIGPQAPPELSTYQLDRAVLDEHLLAQAGALGVEVQREVIVRSWRDDWPSSTLELEACSGERREITTRWLVDASGRAAFVARRKRLLERSESHQTSAVWGRFTGVRNLDLDWEPSSPGDAPALPRVTAQRRLATNHFCGRGWWSWVIPLRCGKTSIGLVWDRELFELPGDGDPRDRFEAFLRQQNGLRELLDGAELDPTDRMSYSHLPYAASKFADRGWAMVGDAGMFLDPLYSPGLDHASISTLATVDLISADLQRFRSADAAAEEALEGELAQHNGRLQRSSRRWLEALYLGKYKLLGDAELVACTFLVDTALYYLGVVSPAYRHEAAQRVPVFGLELPQAKFAHRLARGFNRRLQHLADVRRQQGTYGRRNIGWRPRVAAFRPGWRASLPLIQGLLLWGRMELAAQSGRLRPRRRRAEALAADSAR